MRGLPAPPAVKASARIGGGDGAGGRPSVNEFPFPLHVRVRAYASTRIAQKQPGAVQQYLHLLQQQQLLIDLELNTDGTTPPTWCITCLHNIPVQQHTSADSTFDHGQQTQ